MYVFGFREGWLWIFPDHDPLLIDLVIFVSLFALSYLSANVAFQVQFVIMAVIAASLISVVLAPITFEPGAEVTWIGDFAGFPEEGFQGVDFWVVFAIFFPATTGILAGANMSGDLADPRTAIPRGTLWAVAVSSVIYLVLAWWVAHAASVDELTSNYNVMIDLALWPPAVLAGLLGATFSSALASAVGGPRILMAMARDRLMPASGWLARTSKKGEPRNAIALTAALTLVCLMMRDLNVIAPLVTMFFLITYFTINVVLLIENSLGLVSFRPSLRVPTFVPLLGAGGSAFVMFVVNPTFSLIAVSITVGVYIFMLRRGVKSPGDDVRSGVFGAIAEWAAAKVVQLGDMNERSWKPNLMVPVEDPDELRGEFRLLLDVVLPEGSIKLLGIATDRSVESLRRDVVSLDRSLKRRGVFSNWSIVEAETFPGGCVIGLQALQSAFFRPNILLLRLPADEARFDEYGRVMVQAHNTGVGVMMLALHPKAVLGEASVVNLWVRPAPSGWDIDAAFARNNLDLVLLTGYRLQRRWKAELNLLTAVDSEANVEAAMSFQSAICEAVRLPEGTRREVLVGSIDEAAEQAPHADLNIMGLQENPDFDFMRRMIDETRSSCLFVADSGRENARA